MPGNKYRSIKYPAMYRSLRREGMSKQRAAAITNGRTPGASVKSARGILGRKHKSRR